jgi:hypothetical protein
MKATNINIGSVYDIKVGNHTTGVRIMKLVATGGWEAVTLSGNKTIVIKSADRVVGPHNPKADKAPKPKAATDTGQPEPRGAKQRAAKVLDRISVPLDGKRLSALDAAAKVLAEAKAPLSCKQMIEAMMAKDYWKPSHAGKTPANTLHAAIGSEIKKKGTAARFEKVGRGQFGLRSQ